FVDNDVGIVEGASAHKIQGFELNVGPRLDVLDTAVTGLVGGVHDLQIVVESRQPGGHFFLLGAGQKADILGDGRRGAGHDQLGVLFQLEDGVEAVGQGQQG